MKREPYAWRVYYWPDESSRGYCGQFDSYGSAVNIAESEPDHSWASDWDSNRAAGGRWAFYAPPLDGVESDVATSWHGKDGCHCVVPVYREERE